MSQSTPALIVETYHCHCQHNIKFLVIDDHQTLTAEQKARLKAKDILIVKKGQVIYCPNCQKEIKIS